MGFLNQQTSLGGTILYVVPIFDGQRITTESPSENRRAVDIQTTVAEYAAASRFRKWPGPDLRSPQPMANMRKKPYNNNINIGDLMEIERDIYFFGDFS